MARETYLTIRNIQYVAVLARNKKTGETSKLVYNFLPCQITLQRHFADYIGGDTNDWEIVSVGHLRRKVIGYRDYRYKEYSPLDKQEV